jgi:hypothetical protein
VLQAGAVVTLTGLLMALRGVLLAGTDASGDDYGSDFLRWTREFGKLGMLSAIGIGLPLVAGGLASELLASTAAGWAVAVIAGVAGANGVRALTRRLPSLRLDRKRWEQESHVHFDSFQRRSGIVFWSIVALTLVLVAFLALLGFAASR